MDSVHPKTLAWRPFGIEHDGRFATEQLVVNSLYLSCQHFDAVGKASGQ